MKTDVEIRNIGNIERILRQMKNRTGSPEVEVGYTAKYAIYVHEMTPADPHWGRPRSGKNAKGHYWDPKNKGQPKFLEKSLRGVKPEVAELVKRNLSMGATFVQALYMVGLLVQRNSQKIVPVDKGNLKASAFTRITKR